MSTSNRAAKNPHHSQPQQPANNRPPQPPLDLVTLLPADVREKISRGLKNGETHTGLASRINALPEVRQFMSLHFASQRLTEDHLAAWRQTGHLDWLETSAIDDKAKQLVAAAPGSPIEHALQQLTLRYAAAIALLDERGSDAALEKRAALMERAMKNLLAVLRQPQQEARLDLQRMKLELEAEKFRQSVALAAGRDRASDHGTDAPPTSTVAADPTPPAPPSTLEDEPIPETQPQTAKLSPAAAPGSQPSAQSNAPLENTITPVRPVHHIAGNHYRFGIRY